MFRFKSNWTWRFCKVDGAVGVFKMMMMTRMMRRSSYCVQSQGTGKGSPGAETISKYSDQRLKLYQRGSTFVPNSICDFLKVKYIGRHSVQYNAGKINFAELIFSMKAFENALRWEFDISHLQMSGDKNRFPPALKWQWEPFEDKIHSRLRSKILSQFQKQASSQRSSIEEKNF